MEIASVITRMNRDPRPDHKRCHRTHMIETRQETNDTSSPLGAEEAETAAVNMKQ